ncbi:MAG TPA: hypothetical protein VJ044_14445, partial [Candidatus Hodarchaeales archaeon]|nr:hypothetical protein [Candidatus Hodarchaeales archaeon]
MEANIFSTLVSTLLSFTKGMVESTLQSMKFGNFAIFYAIGPENRFMVVISADPDTKVNQIEKYLSYTRGRLYQFFKQAIDFSSPEFPANLESFSRALRSFILVSEQLSTFPLFSKKQYRLSDTPISNCKSVGHLVGIVNQDGLLSVFNKVDLGLVGVFIPIHGIVSCWTYSDSAGMLCLFYGDTKTSSIFISISEDVIKPVQRLELPFENVSWCIASPNQSHVIVGNSSQWVRIGLEPLKLLDDSTRILPFKTKQVLFQAEMRTILLLSFEGDLHATQQLDTLEGNRKVDVTKNVERITSGIGESIYLHHSGGTLSLSNLVGHPRELRTRAPDFTDVLVSPRKDSAIILSSGEFPDLIIHDLYGNQLASFPLPSKAIGGAFIDDPSENTLRLFLIYEDG